MLGVESGHFVAWIVVQNSVAAVGSWIIGGIADRRGNRIVLGILVLLSACTPLVAVGISRISFGAQLYWIVYALLGLTPVLLRIRELHLGDFAQEKAPTIFGCGESP